jgi:exodeoxyribonuclease-3
LAKDPEMNSGWQEVVLLNIYFPNWWTRADWTEMLSYKLKFYDKIIKYVNNLVNSWKNVIITWDFNICHTEIDIARPEENRDSIWFLPIERAKITEFLNNGYVDTFRHFFPNKTEIYSWWSYRAWARPRNVGWRLDYFLVNENFVENVEEVEYLTKVEGSDHCPVKLKII